MSADARLAAANRIIAEQVRSIARVHQLALAIMRATAEVHVLKLANQIVDTLEQAPNYPAIVPTPQQELELAIMPMLLIAEEETGDPGD